MCDRGAFGGPYVRGAPSAGESSNAAVAADTAEICSRASNESRAENAPLYSKLNASPSTSGWRAPIWRQSSRKRLQISSLWFLITARAG